MTAPAAVPQPGDHAMEIVRDEQRKRGWYLSWHCTARGCPASGNTTTPSRESAQRLFGLVAEGHRRAEAGT
ncbi:hypothetical protein [Micromonospora sp. NPDC005174]|uniref:hypothetical protein n=1 Tax=Micromonospora sp. NPDC005174 TaxID=3157018 RepID=UPI0033A56E3F